MDVWLPGYEHQPINAGLDYTPGTAWKVCLHTTETGPAPSLIGAWRANPGSGLPHFLGITPDRIVQLLPLNVGAYTLQNPPGGVDTNRAHVIQIEVCEFARNAHAWSAPGAAWCEALGRWLAALVRAGIPLDLTTELAFGDRWVGMDPARFPGFAGVFGHQHSPEQPDRHWDPGPIDIGAVLAAARRNLTPTVEDDMPYSEDDLVRIVGRALNEQRVARQPAQVTVDGDPGKVLVTDGVTTTIQTDASLGQTARNLGLVQDQRSKVLPATYALEVLQQFGRTGSGAVNAAEVADAVLADLGPDLARQVADELAKRLAG